MTQDLEKTHLLYNFVKLLVFVASFWRWFCKKIQQFFQRPFMGCNECNPSFPKKGTEGSHLPVGSLESKPNFRRKLFLYKK